MADDVDILQGRNYHTKNIGYLRYDIKANNNQWIFLIGRVPHNSVIVSITAYIQNAFNGCKFKFGTTIEVDDMGELDVGTIGKKVLSIPGTKCFASANSDACIFFTIDKKVDAGQGSIVVEFVTDQ